MSTPPPDFDHGSWHGPQGLSDPATAPETPRARLHRLGPDALSAQELLTLTLGRQGGATPDGTAARLLHAFGSLRALACASARELERIHDLGPATAERLAATLALGKRTHEEVLRPGERLSTSAEIFGAYHARLRDRRQEVFVAIYLDAKNKVIAEQELTRGILTASLVHPREVFRPAIRVNAAGLVLVHNHPSGEPEPSQEDHEVTRRLEAAGNLIGIRVLDHVVIGEGAYVSFLERGLID